MGRRADPTLNWSYEDFVALPEGTWVGVRLGRFKRSRHFRLTGYLSSTDPLVITSSDHGEVKITGANFINFRLAEGAVPAGAFVVDRDNRERRGVVEWSTPDGLVAVFREDGSVEEMDRDEVVVIDEEVVYHARPHAYVARPTDNACTRNWS